MNKTYAIFEVQLGAIVPIPEEYGYGTKIYCRFRIFCILPKGKSYLILPIYTANN